MKFQTGTFHISTGTLDISRLGSIFLAAAVSVRNAPLGANHGANIQFRYRSCGLEFVAVVWTLRCLIAAAADPGTLVVYVW